MTAIGPEIWTSQRSFARSYGHSLQFPVHAKFARVQLLDPEVALEVALLDHLLGVSDLLCLRPL